MNETIELEVREEDWDEIFDNREAHRLENWSYDRCLLEYVLDKRPGEDHRWAVGFTCGYRTENSEEHIVSPYTTLDVFELDDVGRDLVERFDRAWNRGTSDLEKPEFPCTTVLRYLSTQKAQNVSEEDR